MIEYRAINDGVIFEVIFSDDREQLPDGLLQVVQKWLNNPAARPYERFWWSPPMPVGSVLFGRKWIHPREIVLFGSVFYTSDRLFRAGHSDEYQILGPEINSSGEIIGPCPIQPGSAIEIDKR